MNAVNWFEIPVRDMNRAKGFYQSVFKVECQHLTMGDAVMEMFPWTVGDEGSSGCLIQSEGYTPSFEGSLVYFAVEDIEGTLNRVEQNGGDTLIPKMSIGEHGFIAHFKDCEGNRVALHAQQ